MKTLIAVPALSMVHTDFLQSMLALDKPDSQLMIKQNSLVFDARNSIAWTATQNGFDRVLWLDSDMVFNDDLLNRLNADMDENGLDYVSAFFTTRSAPVRPCVYKSLTWEQEGPHVNAHAEPYVDHPDGLFDIAGSGLGAVLMKVELLEAVVEAFGAPFYPLPYLGEDLSFCWRVGRLGRRMVCDGGISVGHIGTHTYSEEDIIHVYTDSESRA